MKKIVSLFLTLFCAFGFFAGTAGATSFEVARVSADESATSTDLVDYAGQAVLDLDATTQTMEATVKVYVDGDTTHFYVQGWNSENLYKARYAGVNTPESTGKLEPWGKTAANFTRSKLETATSIILESDSADWEADSTGDRYLTWVWYKAPGATVYRNLNLELLQEGLALPSGTSDCRYSTLCDAAKFQATQAELCVWSKEKDPNFFYGESKEIDLKELRLNIEYYKDKRVAFEGNVSYNEGQGVYVEDLDEESGIYYGIYVYFGWFLSGDGQKVLSVGNRVRISGAVQYYENGDSYQISDLKYNKYKPTGEDIRVVEKGGHEAANVETTATTFNSIVPTTADFTTQDKDGNATTTTQTKNIKYSKLALNTSISMKGLKVVSAYTTNNGGDSDGAMTLTCQADGKTVIVRTNVLRNPATGELATQDMLIGNTIDVRGIVDYFNGDYQIKVLTNDAITVNNGPLFPPVEPTPPVTSSPSESPEEKGGCGSFVATSAVLTLVAAAFVLLKKREN